MRIRIKAARRRIARVVRVDERRVERELDALRRAGYAGGDPALRCCRAFLERVARRGPLCLELGLVRLLLAQLLASAPESVPVPWTAPRLALFLRALDGLDAQCARCDRCPYDAPGRKD